MGTKFTKTEALKRNLLRDRQVDWQTIYKFLKDGQYVQASSHLCEIQFPESDGDSYLTHMLATAQQICLVCKQVHAEKELHQQAYHDAVQRERELQQQLTLILELMERYLEPGTLSEHDAELSAETYSTVLEEQTTSVENGRSWWQRLRTRLEPKLSKAVVSPVSDSVEMVGDTDVFPTEFDDQTIEPHPTLTVYCLGTFRAYINENFIDNWNGNKSKSIFKYLVTHRDRPIPLEVLMDIFWRDDGPDSARRNLYQAIYLVRQALQTGCPDYSYILSMDGCYCLNPKLTLWLDSEAFTKHYETGLRLEAENHLLESFSYYEKADSLYEGEFLAEDPYDDWPIVLRENLKSTHLDLLDRLSQFHFTQQRWAMVIAYCQKILSKDSCREDAHQRLMLAYCHQGQRHLALRQYHYCMEAMQEELDAVPAPETCQLYRNIQHNHLQF